MIGRKMMRFTAIEWGSQLLLLSLFIATLAWGHGSPAVSGQKDGVCVSQGGQFPKFSLEGQRPRKASKGAIDLTLCRFYRQKTCCDVVQTHAALLSLQRLATGGEGSKECLEMWEVLECSICDPHVGVTPGPPLLCQSFCQSLFSACAEAFFSTEPLTEVLTPCLPKSLLCAKGNEWASNGSTFCQLAGFLVLNSDYQLHSLEEKTCFDGKVESAGSSNHIVDTNQKNPRRIHHYGALDMLKNWMENMDIVERIMWAIGGLVLTAGALHLRRRNIGKRGVAAALLRDKRLQEERRARYVALYGGSGISSGVKKDRRKSPRAV